MIRTLAYTHDDQLLTDVPLNDLCESHIKWYWVDFNKPTEEEAVLLDTHFHFHPLAVEDCFHLLQRPKLDHYENEHFFVMHALHPNTFAAEEIDLFLGDRYIVTFHHNYSREIEDAWGKLVNQIKDARKGPIYAAYLVMDKLVDQYFPCVYEIEEELNDIENNVSADSIQTLMDNVFDIRSKLLKLRRTVVPMRDLLYRIINSDRIHDMEELRVYFIDVHDHLLKLSEMIESNREMTSDLRDSYLSINSNRMNTIMKTLTVMTAVFIPMTFIASIYGMNFVHIPELELKWGYFAALGLMFTIGGGLLLWFNHKGWFK
ncbi:magnesium and cobalt transport protein CorA [Paenibacillus nanensis]|uniref:Magnesium transport protein CorA n=1 Tax=Paenibacillus nanensis TaxID=393251 RepID=A0A3A1UQD5_9BACL|nr:magnesium/cobalt transporter CorA [Paenibacillus nanensis]RIX48746.1 magnesium and cobalt transport protein CorA [Paenibacillus nanensis]